MVGVGARFNKGGCAATYDTTRELRLATVLVEVVDTLAESFEVTDHLRRVADHRVELPAARGPGSCSSTAAVRCR